MSNNEARAAQARIIAVEKWLKAAAPTEAEKLHAVLLYAKLGADRAEANMRGNSKDRLASRIKLVREFGDGVTCSCVYCGAELTVEQVERDRIYPGQAGGRYRHDNLVPACSTCNKQRGAKDFGSYAAAWLS